MNFLSNTIDIWKYFLKIISENLVEINETKNYKLMDLEVSIRLGNGCKNLIRFYGALYIDVIIYLIYFVSSV